jgi:hypothetical protein
MTMRPSRILIGLVVPLLGLVTACSVGSGTTGTNRTAGTSTSPTSPGHAVPAAIVGGTATCSARSPSGATASATRQRPPEISGWVTQMVMDSRAGQVIRWAGGETSADGASTWTFDVCSNTWQRRTPAVQPTGHPFGMVYDPRIDQAVLIIIGYPGPTTWTYALGADRWTALPASTGGPGISVRGDLTVDPTTPGRLVLWDNTTATLWSYRLAGNVWSKVAVHGTAPAAAQDPGYTWLGAESGSDQVLLILARGDDRQTWTYDLTAGTWTRHQVTLPWINAGYGETNGEMVYDPVEREFVLFSFGQLLTYRPQTDWQTAPHGTGWPDAGSGLAATPSDLVPSGPMVRLEHAMVYDPVNQRVLMFGGQARIPDWTTVNDVWAYSPAANAWTQLLASAPTTP